MKTKLLIAALIFPIVALMILVGIRAYKARSGYEMQFQVQGYDPRDILAGHFVTYSIDYGIEENCGSFLRTDEAISDKAKSNQELCLCFPDAPAKDNAYWQMDCATAASECPVHIKGTCRYSRFEAGIEKFFVPEDQADAYDDIVRKQGATLIVKIDAKGNAAISDLKLPMTIEEWNAAQKKPH